MPVDGDQAGALLCTTFWRHAGALIWSICCLGAVMRLTLKDVVNCARNVSSLRLAPKSEWVQRMIFMQPKADETHSISLMCIIESRNMGLVCGISGGNSFKTRCWLVNSSPANSFQGFPQNVVDLLSTPTYPKWMIARVQSQRYGPPMKIDNVCTAIG